MLDPTLRALLLPGTSYLKGNPAQDTINLVLGLYSKYILDKDLRNFLNPKVLKCPKVKKQYETI